MTNDPLHKRMTPEMIRRLLFINKVKPVYLTKWEAEIVNDRLQALQTFKSNAVITQKQVYSINKIFDKVRVNEKLTRTEFNRLEGIE